MKTEKGEVDLITLVVGITPMILFIILSGYILVENPVETDLSNQITFQEAHFESMMALSHILVYNDTLERINNYSEFPEDPANVEAIIESDINDSTSYISDTIREDRVGDTPREGSSRPRIEDIFIDNMGREFMVNVTMPEEDNISVSTPDTGGAFIASKANIASPKPDPITVMVVLNRG